MQPPQQHHKLRWIHLLQLHIVQSNIRFKSKSSDIILRKYSLFMTELRRMALNTQQLRLDHPRII